MSESLCQTEDALPAARPDPAGQTARGNRQPDAGKKSSVPKSGDYDTIGGG